jgi:hypothetical protein
LSGQSFRIAAVIYRKRRNGLGGQHKGM